MTVYIVYGKPCISVSNGFQPISDYEYYMMIENDEIGHVEVIEYD